MPRATIKDVATLAGVSITTVSRVLNNNYPVSKKTQKKVLDAVKQCDFSINSLASTLKSKKSKLIGLAIPGIVHGSFMQLATGLKEIVEKNGDSLIIIDTNDDEVGEKKALTILRERMVDGVVLVSSSYSTTEVDKLKKSGIKVVLADRIINNTTEYDSVVWNNYDTTVEMVERLIEMGHQRIGIVCAQNRFNVGKERLAGYIDTLKKHNILPLSEYYDNKNSNLEEAYETVLKMFELENPPTALIGLSYFCCKGILKASLEKGYKIPKDISVINFGGIDINEYYKPQISTAEQDLAAMGREAGKMLFANDNTNFVKKIVLKPTIIDRGSIQKK